MPASAGYKSWIIARLRDLIEFRRKSVAGIEKELGWKRGYLADALRGDKRFPLEVLLPVLDHLRMDPRAFFAGQTADGEGWESAQEIAEEAARGAAPAQDLGAMNDLLWALVHLLESKGVLEPKEIRAAVARERRKR